MEYSADNQAFENNEEILEEHIVPKPIVPFVRYTNTHFDPFDSISAFSETTVPSEFAEIEVEAYELQKKLKLENESKQKSSNIQYNLRFDKVVIVGGNENKDVSIGTPVTHAVNEITQKVNFDEIPLKFVAMDENRYMKLIQRRICYIPLIFVILGLIGGLSYSIYAILRSEDLRQSHSSTSEPSSTSTKNPQTDTSSTIAPKTLKFVKRSEWLANDSIPIIAGKYKLIAPVNKIILVNAITSHCDTEQTCIEYMNEQQQNAFPDYDDIRENFIIALDGTIFEGRGFEREGETTCESDGITCYNNKAISMSFVLMADDDEVNSKQRTAFCEFIKENQQTGNIDGYFNVFNENNLISSTAVLGGNDELQDCCHFSDYYVPQIMRRNKTLDIVDDELQRRFSTRVVLTTTGGKTCDTMDECREIVENLSSNSNFIFNSNGIIFEDRNFDLAVNESLYDVLLLSIIGNYSTSLPSQPLITRLYNEFLEFAVVLGKLPRNHKICVTNEAQTLITAVRNHHPSKYDNFCNE